MKKHFNTLGYCAAFLAIMLSLMPCCCVMSRLTSALCGGSSARSCCRKAETGKKSGVSTISSDHKCCCDQSSKVKEKPSTSTVVYPTIDQVVVPTSVALGDLHSDAIAALISENSSAPPVCPFHLSCTNLLI